MCCQPTPIGKRKTLQDVVHYYSVGLLLISIFLTMNGCKFRKIFEIFLLNPVIHNEKSLNIPERTDAAATGLWLYTFGMGIFTGVLGITTASLGISSSKTQDITRFKMEMKTVMVWVKRIKFILFELINQRLMLRFLSPSVSFFMLLWLSGYGFGIIIQ